jgi:uncharacterized protein
MDNKIVYFEKQGESYTDQTLAMAKKRADELGIKTIVLASSGGNTAAKAVNIFQGMKIIAVTHCAGHNEPNKIGITEENRKLVESKGGVFLTATEGFGGIQSAVRSGMPSSVGNDAPHVVPPKTGTGDIVAATLRMFSLGMKAALEVAAMAVDAGLARNDEEIIAIAGSHRGADTALVIKPANVHRFFDIKVREIICKPRNSDF